MADLIYNRRLEEAKELLALAMDILKDSIEDGYCVGSDVETYSKIVDFLEVGKNE